MGTSNHKDAAVKMLFIVLLFLVMAAPQLMSSRPTAGFAEIRALLESTPLVTWIVIGVMALVALAGISFVKYLRTPSTEAVGTTAQRLPIQDAVLPQNKGNGLASDTFPLDLPWFGIAGWLQIEAGKECIVIDGKRVIRQTQICFTPMRLIGKPIYARRVLLEPAPLTDLSAKALTKDQLELTLVTTMKYTVTNPVHVATQQAPLTQLTELITGTIAEYIRSDTLESTVGDNDGAIRRKLKAQLENSPSIRGYYAVAEVLKALPTGDERIIELIRKIREETSRQGLIEQQGANELVKAEYERRIEREKAELQDEFVARQHERDLEMQQIQLQAQTLREVMIMVAQIASSGVNPTGSIEEIRKLLHSSNSTTVKEISGSTSTKEDMLVVERQMLERHRDALEITFIEIKPHPDKQTSPGKAQINFPDFTLFIDCTGEYPQRPPTVQIQLNDGDKLDVTVPWQEGSHLLEVAATAKMRAQAELANHVKTEGSE